MKKITLMLAGLMIAGGVFACDGNKTASNCKKGGSCCKKSSTSTTQATKKTETKKAA